jgi:DNA sulfur modification protein DndC
MDLISQAYSEGGVISEREELIKHYARDKSTLWFYGHSGGKDSMAGYERICELVPLEQIIVVHAHLGDVEHAGVVEHIERNIHPSHKLHVVKADVDFYDLVLLRGKFPSPKYRNCTSTLKTAAIDKLIRAICTERNCKVAFNVTGIRALESRQRAMKLPLWVNSRLTVNKRTVFDFMPVFDLDTDEVFAAITNANKTWHPAYGINRDGNQRLSCIFCIMGSLNDLINGAVNYPEQYHRMVALERVVDFTMFIKKRVVSTMRGNIKVRQEVIVNVPLNEMCGVEIDEVAVARHVKALTVRRAELLAAAKVKKEAREKKQMSNKAPNDNQLGLAF